MFAASEILLEQVCAYPPLIGIKVKVATEIVLSFFLALARSLLSTTLFILKLFPRFLFEFGDYFFLLLPPAQGAGKFSLEKTATVQLAERNKLTCIMESRLPFNSKHIGSHEENIMLVSCFFPFLLSVFRATDVSCRKAGDVATGGGSQTSKLVLSTKRRNARQCKEVTCSTAAIS